MASKLPKLVLPAYDLKTKQATYRHYAEAVYKANPGIRSAVTKEVVDKGWVAAVKEHWPGNLAKREKMFRQTSSIPTIQFWDQQKREEEYFAWSLDHFRGTRTLGAARINGMNIALPNCNLEHLDYVRFARTTLPGVNANIECTREIVDGAWVATVESHKFKATPRKVKEAALAQAKTAKANHYWKEQRRAQKT